MIAMLGVSQVPLVPNAKRDMIPLEMLRSCGSAFGKSTARFRLCFHQVACTSGVRAPEALLAHARHLFFFLHVNMVDRASWLALLGCDRVACVARSGLRVY